MKMKMEKQFKVIIEDEDVWITEAWGSREGNASKTNSWLVSLGAFILINQKKKKLEHMWAFSISI